VNRVGCGREGRRPKIRGWEVSGVRARRPHSSEDGGRPRPPTHTIQCQSLRLRKSSPESSVAPQPARSLHSLAGSLGRDDTRFSNVLRGRRAPRPPSQTIQCQSLRLRKSSPESSVAPQPARSLRSLAGSLGRDDTRFSKCPPRTAGASPAHPSHPVPVPQAA
jgi:hypothetical protein